MTVAPFEQRNPYKGQPERPWIRFRLAAPDGATTELDLLAHTGNPCSVIISQEKMLDLKAGDGPDISTNFGLLQGGWLQLAMPELGLVRPVLWATPATQSWRQRKPAAKGSRGWSACPCRG